MEAALDLRSRCLASPNVRFRAEIRADYITGFEEFTLDCETSPDGTVVFRVLSPEEIADICGTVRRDEGTVEFDGAVLAYPLMAQGRLSPLGGPWVVMKAIRSGCILAAGREGEMIHVTIDDSYDDHALTVDLWLEEGELEEAEIAWEGRRCISMTFDDFSA
jgi:hypothetical protein